MDHYPMVDEEEGSPKRFGVNQEAKALLRLPGKSKVQRMPSK